MTATVSLKKPPVLVVVYYSVLLLALIFASRPEVEYSLVLRFIYFGMVLVPLLLYPKLTPAVITCFWGICSNSFYALLPDNNLYLIVVVVLILAFNPGFVKYGARAPIIFWILWVYTLFISIIFSDLDQNFIKVLFLFILLFPFVKDREDIYMLSLGICMMSLALSALYLMNFKYFSTTIGQTDFEVGAWGNINTLAGAVACGFPVAFANLMGTINGRRSLLIRILMIACMVVSIIVVFASGSRGALSAVAVSSVLILASSNSKKSTKVFAILGIAVMLVILYQEGVMDFLFYRVTELDTNDTAGGRTAIWLTKLSALYSSDIIDQLFGIGRHNCNNLGVYYSTHNDFVTSVVGFGYLGFVMFTIFMYIPIAGIKIRKSIFPIALWSFIIIESFVLEPYFRGYIPFYAFYLLVIKYVELTKKERVLT